jgi:pimeloyl-ACP methyl ester carboxylesterase
MTGIREPPKQGKTSPILVRILVLILLLLAVAAVIWTATTKTLIRATEDVSLESLEIETRHEMGGATVNIIEEPGGPVPVVLLHGYDISGGILWDGVVSHLEEEYHAVRIDLPGFGMSDRLPERGRGHTVASMAEVVAAVMESEFDSSVVVVGVGLGGEVAAELAVTKPGLVRGIVMIDVDFWERRGWIEIAERLPWIGEAVTYTFETGGRFSMDQWAPWCDEGGWCPTRGQANARDLAASIVNSTDSMLSFLRTPPASLVPTDLDLIEVPVAYVWSSGGVVPQDSVDRVATAITGEFELVTVDSHQAQLENPGAVAATVATVDP